MKKLIALSAALFLIMSAPLFAIPPRGGANPPKDKVVVNPKPVKKGPAVRGTITPRPIPAPAPAPVMHGKKKGWYKNPHNPHNPQSNNPGHARH